MVEIATLNGKWQNFQGLAHALYETNWHYSDIAILVILSCEDASVYSVSEKKKSKCFCYIFYTTWAIMMKFGSPFPE